MRTTYYERKKAWKYLKPISNCKDDFDSNNLQIKNVTAYHDDEKLRNNVFRKLDCQDTFFLLQELSYIKSFY